MTNMLLNLNWTAVTDGLVVAVVGYVIVFTALMLLYIFYNNLPKLLNMQIRKRLRAKGVEVKDDENVNVTADENAVISAAIFLYFNELHDEENTVMTIKKVSKTYSPWSSKIYGLRRHPRN